MLDIITSKFSVFSAQKSNHRILHLSFNTYLDCLVRIDEDKNKEFMDALNSSLVQFLTVRKNNFVLLNSMTLGNDNCSLCSVVDQKLSDIERKFRHAHI